MILNYLTEIQWVCNNSFSSTRQKENVLWDILKKCIKAGELWDPVKTDSSDDG